MTSKVSLKLSYPDRHMYICLFVCPRDRTELVLGFQLEDGAAVPGRVRDCDGSLSFDQVLRSFRNFGFAASSRAVPAIVCWLKQSSG